MSEVVSMSSGPQGTASSDDAFEGAPSDPSFGHESGTEEHRPTEDHVPGGTNGNGNGEDGRPKSAAQQKQESRYERTKKERAAFKRSKRLSDNNKRRLLKSEPSLKNRRSPSVIIHCPI